ncbi:GntR family transcriptional regulator [Frankia sp. AgB1.9]|uniref:GntR family transcriptional regulator n=1 Tax=unclassified Frankia TaxID=2632575 RepID=UPI001932A75D|nr:MULTISPECIES: GntR family transcriptional regulator [unclassified Frankia]MBL7490857.1 GntR family transcriptional regulator [Frankia sp. AgW1.1]MBL7550909.1 GntR family transcriptional regulator [Frankia sp. AgB1.9]MBL7624418.1 GntR family transcriptional regulator [Frankia sp. AgB1.8]
MVTPITADVPAQDPAAQDRVAQDPVAQDPKGPGESLSRRIYDQLREGIIRGRYPQGTRLAEQRLAEELSVSRVPLREAVPLLAVDGFVRTLPRRGAVVNTWTLGMAHELFDLRLCMEVGAARFAARQVGLGRSARPLRDVLERSREGVRTRDAYRIAADSTEFHEVVVDLTANTLMRSVMRSVTGRMMWLFYLTSDLDADDALDGHEELLSAIESGKERVAEAIAYAHIERDRDESMRVLVERRGIANLA